jgi:hypothetical protein
MHTYLYIKSWKCPSIKKCSENIPLAVMREHEHTNFKSDLVDAAN